MYITYGGTERFMPSDAPIDLFCHRGLCPPVGTYTDLSGNDNSEAED